MNVECSQRSMIATLHSPAFMGQLFAIGRPNVCGVSGTGTNTTQLIIPVPAYENENNRCNVKLVRSLGSSNRFVTIYIKIKQNMIS